MLILSKSAWAKNITSRRLWENIPPKIAKTWCRIKLATPRFSSNYKKLNQKFPFQNPGPIPLTSKATCRLAKTSSQPRFCNNKPRLPRVANQLRLATRLSIWLVRSRSTWIWLAGDTNVYLQEFDELWNHSFAKVHLETARSFWALTKRSTLSEETFLDAPSPSCKQSVPIFADALPTDYNNASPVFPG